MRPHWLMLALFLLTGCQQDARPIMDPNPNELTRDPGILLRSPDRWAEFSLHSLQMGQDAGRINPTRISSVNERSGWTVLRDANRYRIRKGIIDGLGIWDQKLKSQDQVAAKFGKPSASFPISTNVTVYEYQDGHLHVFWNSLERRLVGIEVTK